MAFARVYVGAHFPLDVLAGLAAGAVVALLVQRAEPALARPLTHLETSRLRPLLTTRAAPRPTAPAAPGSAPSRATPAPASHRAMRRTDERSPCLPGVFHSLEPLLDNYGYLAVAGLVFVENFGVPVPGEPILIAAAVFGRQENLATST